MSHNSYPTIHDMDRLNPTLRLLVVASLALKQQHQKVPCRRGKEETQWTVCALCLVPVSLGGGGYLIGLSDPLLGIGLSFRCF